VVAASITLEGAAEISMPNGRLRHLIEVGLELARNPPPVAPAPAPPPVVAAAPEPKTGEAVPTSAVGTAFFVNNTDLVTAKHVVEDCESISFTDGTKLELLSQHPTLDVAVLVSPRRSRDWIPVHLTGEAKLGQRINALGYPYFGTTGTTLNTTGGNVSALRGLDDDPRQITISAPVQPGNSGGPLLAQDGTVIGVVVARLNKQFIAEATGTLPENINYAVTGQELLAFLDTEGVSLPRSNPREAFDLDEGIPEGMQRAVVPILCARSN
jgi:S1-C subfamily serine protease